MTRDVPEPADPFAGPPPDTADPDDAPAPTLLLVAWQQAEAQLYPAVTTRPDLYERIVRLVRATVDRLRELGTGTSALVAAAERGRELVAEVVDDTGIPLTDLDLDLIARAALAMRYREVRVEQAARRRLRTVAEARAAGQPWVVVEESGAPDGDPFLPYTRVEVEVATGRALLVTATPDDDYRRVEHRVRTVRLDRQTGEITEDPAAPPTTTHGDAAAREAAAARSREQRTDP